MSKKLATTIYITEHQQQMLKELNRRSKVPIAEYIREGIDMVLEKYSDQLPGQMELQPLAPGIGADGTRGSSETSRGRK